MIYDMIWYDMIYDMIYDIWYMIYDIYLFQTTIEHVTYTAAWYFSVATYRIDSYQNVVCDHRVVRNPPMLDF